MAERINEADLRALLARMAHALPVEAWAHGQRLLEEEIERGRAAEVALTTERDAAVAEVASLRAQIGAITKAADDCVDLLFAMETDACRQQVRRYVARLRAALSPASGTATERCEACAFPSPLGQHTCTPTTEPGKDGESSSRRGVCRPASCTPLAHDRARTSGRVPPACRGGTPARDPGEAAR